MQQDVVKLSPGKFDGPAVGAPKLTPIFKYDKSTSEEPEKQKNTVHSSCWEWGEGSCGCCTFWSAICWHRARSDAGAVHMKRVSGKP